MGLTRTAHVLIGASCVNNCVFCATSIKREEGRSLDRESVLRFIDECSASGVLHLVFSGIGEPTLDPHFEDYLEAANRMGIRRIGLFTSGYGLTSTRARRWKDYGLGEVLVSLHGLQPGHERNVRRAGSFKEALHALDTYAAQGYRVSVNTCLTRHNLEEIDGLRGLLELYPLHRHTLTFPEWSGNAARCFEDQITYEEASSLAGRLPRSGAPPADFENVPLCLLGGRNSDLRPATPILYLDGTRETVWSQLERGEFPEVCRASRCSFRADCPGFDAAYIARHGWGRLPAMVAAARADNGRSAAAAGAVAASPTRGDASDLDHRSDIVVIVKPTGRCTGRCAYCSSAKATAAPDMTGGVLAAMYERVFAYAAAAGIGKVKFLWHGGEPLLMGKDFFRTALDGAGPRQGLLVEHQVQSNLLGLDEEWIELFLRHGVRLSTSVDPFSSTRILEGGRPQFPEWMDRLALLARAGMGVGIVFTVTPDHVGREEEVYRFFKNLQAFAGVSVAVKLNPLYPAGRAAGAVGPLRLLPEDYGAFLGRINSIWSEDGRGLPLAPLQEWTLRERPSCESSGNCHEHFLAVDGAGNVFNCGRFADTGLPLGNLLESDLSTLARHPLRRDLSRRSSALQAGHCRGCLWWEDCHGGCPYLAELYHGDLSRETPFCAVRRKLFEVVSPHERKAARA